MSCDGLAPTDHQSGKRKRRKEKRHYKCAGFIIRQLLSFDLTCNLILSVMPDVIRIPWGRYLPPASFRFHLTMGTLAIG